MTDDHPDPEPDPVAEAFDRLPFVERLGIDLLEARDGHASAELRLRASHCGDPGASVAHGGVTYALADTVAGAAVVSLHHDVTPTVDMRIDYLAPATSDLSAEAEVVGDGDAVARVDVVVTDAAGERVALCRGTYKTGGATGDSPWLAGAPDQTGSPKQ